MKDSRKQRRSKSLIRICEDCLQGGKRCSSVLFAVVLVYSVMSGRRDCSIVWVAVAELASPTVCSSLTHTRSTRDRRSLCPRQLLSVCAAGRNRLGFSDLGVIVSVGCTAWWGGVGVY
jgi:hypothetical protein